MVDLASAGGSAGIPPPHNNMCVTDKVIGSVNLWTPIVMVNSPYLGSATGSSSGSVYSSFTITSGAVVFTSTSSTTTTASVSASNGQAVGQFELDTWTFYSVKNKLSYTNKPCTQTYVAKITARIGSYTGAYELLSAGSTSQANEITSFTRDGYKSIVFHNEYTRADGQISTCGTGDANYGVTQTTSTSLSFSVTLGASTTALGTLGITSGSSTTQQFNYWFPGNSGIWYYTNLRGASGPINSALAFSWASCGASDNFENTGLWTSAKSGGSSFLPYALYGYSTQKYVSPTHSIVVGYTGGGYDGTDGGSAWNYRDFYMTGITRIKIAYYDSLYSHDGWQWDLMSAGMRMRLYNSAGTNYATYEYWLASWYQGQVCQTPPNANVKSITCNPTLNTWLTLDRNPSADWTINWSQTAKIRIELFVVGSGTAGDQIQMFFDDFSMS
jgi:hypothetical protein